MAGDRSLLLFFLLFSCYVVTWSSNVNLCHQNPCQNDGTCYRVSDHPVSQLCDANFTNYNGRCYQLVLNNPLPWANAQIACNDMGAELAAVRNAEERKFIAAYIEQIMARQNRAMRELNIWTAGHGFADVDGPAWVWMPLKDLMVSEKYWDPGQPNIHPNYSDACVAITERALYTTWISQSCSSINNFFLCEKKDQTAVIADGKYAYQCQCQNGYRGVNCEVPPLSTATGTPSQSTTCGTEGFEFACSTGEGATILVDYAAYGVVDDKLPSACQSGTQRLGDGFCTHPAALSTMIQRCQGLSYCKLPPLQEVFMDSPCTPGSPTYLDYRFRCQTEPLTRCIAGASYFQGRCYTVNYQPNRTDRLTWQLARKQCWEKGGELAGPIDETVHNFLAGRIQSTRNDSVNYFWIGMSNTANNGPVWISGNPATDYSPTGSVYNGSDDCVAYYYSPKPAGTFWKNSTCDGYYNWICEYAPIESERPTLFDPNWNVPTTIGPIYVPKTTLPPTSMPAPTRAQQVDPITINDQSEYSTAPPPMTAVSNMVTTTTSGPTQNSAFGNIVECPETTWKGITFAKTAAGNDATAPCPNPTSTTGQIRYQCTKVGNAAQWSAKGASMIECRHKWVGDLHEKIVLKKAAENISRELHMQLGSTVDLYGGDISGSVDIAEKLIPLAKEQFSYTFDTTDRNKRAADFTHTMGAAGDQLLSERAIPLWDEFAKNDRISMASNLMGVLEQGANLLATYLERSSKAFTYQNWAMRVQVHRSQMQPMGGGSSPGVSSFSAPSAGPEDDAMRPVQLPGRPDMMPTREGFTVNSDVFNFRPSDDTLSNEPVTNTFVNFSNAPSMSLPSFNVLKSALRTEGGPVNQPLPEDDDPTAKLVPASAAAPELSSTSDRGGAAGFGPNRIVSFQQDDSVKLGYYMFTSLGALLNADDKTIINSHVIGASVNDPERSLKLPEDAPATFTFYHLRKEGVSNVRCVFWNSTERKWSENGCHIVKTSKEATDCSCDHLTSFAILMDLTGDAEGSLSSTNAEILNIITIVGCAASIVCLVLCIIVFTCFRSLWNNRNTIHRNLCICLLLAELVFVIGIDRTENATVCSAIAVALHYLFLAAFCWMLLEGYQLYLMLIQVFESEKSKVLVYLLWAYGFPAVVVAVSAGVAWQNYGTENYCWLNVDTPTIWAFVGPVAVVIIANFIFLVVALKVVLSVKSREKSRTSRIKGWLKGSTMLLCLLGSTWIFGFLTVIQPAQVVFAYVFTILNCLQGVFIFLFHVVFNEKVRATVVRWLRRQCCCCSDDYSSSGSNSASYPSSRQRLKNMLHGHSDDSHPSTASTDPSQPRSPSSPPPAYWSSTASTDKSSSVKGGVDNPLPTADTAEELEKYVTHKDCDLHGKTTKYTEWRSKLDDNNHHCSKRCEETQPYPFPPDKAAPTAAILRTSTLESKQPVRRKKYPLGTPIEQRGSQGAKDDGRNLHYTIINTTPQNGIVSYANPTIVEHF